MRFKDLLFQEWLDIVKSDSVNLRQIVSSLQWSVSGVVVIAVMLLLTGIEVWDWLAWLGGLYVAFVGPASMIVGMVMVWNLPDWRKWMVVPIEVFILFTGMGLIHIQVEKSKSVEAISRREAFLNGAEYKTALDTYNQAKAKMDALTARLKSIPGDFTTGARENDAASTKNKADFETAKAAWIAIDAKAPKQPDMVTAAGSFRIFGANNSDWLEALILFILAAGNECIALALSWKPNAIPVPVQESKKRTEDEPKEAPHEPETKPRLIFGEQQEAQRTWEEYYAAAIHGRTDGRVWGREKVCEALGISERQGRKLYAECIEKGKIIPAPPSAPKVGVANTEEG